MHRTPVHIPPTSAHVEAAPRFMTPRARGALAVVLITYFILAPLYSLVTPPLEAPDAYYHFGVIHYFSNHLALPPYENPEEHPWTHAVFHAPLYYMLSGLLVAPIDTSDFPEQWSPNPHARIGLPHSLNNRNYVSFKGEPWQQSYLAVYVVRAFSIFWGAVSLTSIFILGRYLFPDRLIVAFVAALFVALTPQFLYMSAVINNDNMVVALSLVALVMLVYAIRFGYSWRLFGWMGLAMAAGSLAKVNALTLYPPVALGLIYLWWRDKWSMNRLLLYGSIILGTWAIMAGWWYLRNLIVLGDFTGTTPLAITAGGASGVPTGLDNLWDEFVGVYYSFWGLFGWFNIIAPPLLYDWVTFFLGIALIGVIYALLRRQTSWDARIITLLLVIHAIVVFLSWWRFRGMVPAAQGRMLFSVLGVLAIGTAYGMLVWKPSFPRIVPAVFLGGLSVAAISFPFTLLTPAYKTPERLTDIPSGAHLVDVRYGPVVLRGYSIEPTPVDYWRYRVPQDREFVQITLYWQPLERTEQPLSMFVQVYAPDADFEPVEVGKVDSYPGGGMMRTDTWEVGIIYADTYYLELYGDFELTPFEPRFRIGLRDNDTDTYIQATTIDGEPILAVVPHGGAVFSREVTCEALENGINVNYENLVRLTGWSVPRTTTRTGETLDVYLQWDVLSTTPDDYRVFVQLIDPTVPEILLGSGDSAPRGNWYPTYRWVAGVCFNDRFLVQVMPETSPGNYRLLVGLYHAEVGHRIPASSDDATSLLGGGYLLDVDITVE
jgi:hypothetical protein